MQPDTSCPRCGQPLIAGRCAACGFSSDSAPAGTDVFHTSTVKYWVAGITAYVLLCTSVLTYLGRRMMRDLKPNNLHHGGPVARREELKGSGRIYLVQMGDHRDPYSLDDLARWLHAKYALDVRVLPPTPIHPFAWNASRGQYVAESVYAQLKWDHPDLALDPDAYLIGFTDSDIYTTTAPWSAIYSQRDWRRAAVISSNGLQDTGFDLGASFGGRNGGNTAGPAVRHFQAPADLQRLVRRQDATSCSDAERLRKRVACQTDVCRWNRLFVQLHKRGRQSDQGGGGAQRGWARLCAQGVTVIVHRARTVGMERA
jgi:hypothetical protein